MAETNLAVLSVPCRGIKPTTLYAGGIGATVACTATAAWTFQTCIDFINLEFFFYTYSLLSIT